MSVSGAWGARFVAAHVNESVSAIITLPMLTLSLGFFEMRLASTEM